jgi:hypothetical protein
MASNGIWRTLERVANVIGIIWVLAALGLLGYFARMGLALLHHAG